ncbi:MAG: hypothetical protein GY788_11575 [bacterium]|nr:hypothetical protein [bacterium]
MEAMIERPVHLCWEGPFDLIDLPKLSDPETDIGLYQIYAHHPVYGRCLVYIGKAQTQTFGQRIRQEQWDTGSENDPERVEIYVGRLIGRSTPSLSEWHIEIDAAEKLLIHSHAPAYNSQNILNAPAPLECGDVRVLNWGACRSLAREVSGWMWTSKGVTLRDQPRYRASAVAPE